MKPKAGSWKPEARRPRSGVTLFFSHPWRLPGAVPQCPKLKCLPRGPVSSAKPIALFTIAKTVYRILDEGFLCHAGFVVDGQPFVIPTSYGRKDASLYIHGSAASRMLRQLKDGVPVCITVTLLEGLVLARSIFNHSMNYRSVVVLGQGNAGGRSARKARGPANSVRTHSARPLGRLAPAQRARTQSHVSAARADRRILRESAPRPGHRRRGRLRVPHLGRSRAAGNGRRRAD